MLTGETLPPGTVSIIFYPYIHDPVCEFEGLSSSSRWLKPFVECEKTYIESMVMFSNFL